MRFGIIGTGRIARRFVPECMAVSDASITAVYNPHEGSAKRFIDETWDAQVRDKPCATSDIYRLWDITDAIYIASPHETHFGYIMLALVHGKHVLCEKPMVFTANQAIEVFDEAEKRGLVLIEAIKTAYCPGYERVLDLIGSGVIGDVRYVEACFTKLENPEGRELNDTRYGGSFTELGSYVMLPVLDILGTDYMDVSFGGINDGKGLDLFTKADIRYSDAMASITCGLGVKSEGRLLISGTRGYVKVDAPWWKTSHIEVHFEDESMTESYDELFEGDGLRYEIGRLWEMASMDRNARHDYMYGSKARSVKMADIMERFLSRRAA